ncbi:MAG TPA: hypothetical protein VHF65_07735 [Nitrososphaera sp.]|nr:hypothetical protein [Nitrososphaera sp.]
MKTDSTRRTELNFYYFYYVFEGHLLHPDHRQQLLLSILLDFVEPVLQTQVSRRQLDRHEQFQVILIVPIVER